MKLQLIRCATIRLELANHTFLIDPYLAGKGIGRSYTGTSRSPLVDLPFPISKILSGVETVIVSHLHSDHFDQVAQSVVPKELPIICQPEDEAAIRNLGFRDVHPINQDLHWRGIEIRRVPGKHGSGSVLREMGSASGFFFEAANELTVYWAGDTILSEEIREMLIDRKPGIVITHSCGAVWGDRVKIVMDAEQTVEVCKLLPQSTIIATHMDTLDHATVSGESLRHFADKSGIVDTHLLIPDDGDILIF